MSGISQAEDCAGRGLDMPSWSEVERASYGERIREKGEEWIPL